MKKTSKLLLGSIMGLCLAAFSSCGNGELSKGEAEDALEDQLVMFQDSSQVVSLATGYYEENDEDRRFALKKLAAAGMVTYKVDLIIESRQSWYSVRKYPHYFVTVALTEAGKKFVVNEPVTEIKDKDMENREKEKVYPEDSVIPGDDLNSILPPQESSSEEITGNFNESDVNAVSRTRSASPSELSEYDKAKARVSIREYNLLSHFNVIVKIQKIYCPEEMLKKGEAACVFIYKYEDVTPFGRILNGVQEGDRFKKTATFTKFIGAGWEVANS